VSTDAFHSVAKMLNRDASTSTDNYAQNCTVTLTGTTRQQINSAQLISLEKMSNFMAVFGEKNDISVSHKFHGMLFVFL